MTLTNTTSISIIVPNYNGSGVLCDLLQSIREQDYTGGHIELIIVDDASVDNSLDIVQSSYPEAITIQNGRRKGAAYSKNRGIHAARGEWLVFLDSDIVLTKSFLTELFHGIEESEKTAFQPKILFLGKPDVLNSTGGVANMFGYAWDRGIYEEDKSQYDDSRNILFASTAAMFIKRSTITSAGLFDADYEYLNEDFDLGYRLHMMGGWVQYIPNAVCYHRMSHTMGRENARVKYLMERNRITTLFKNYEFKTLLKIVPELFRIKHKKYSAYMRSGGAKRAGYINAALGSWFWVLINLIKIFIKRKRVQRLRRVSDEEIFFNMGDRRKLFPSFSKWADMAHSSRLR